MLKEQCTSLRYLLALDAPCKPETRYSSGGHPCCGDGGEVEMHRQMLQMFARINFTGFFLHLTLTVFIKSQQLWDWLLSGCACQIYSCTRCGGTSFFASSIMNNFAFKAICVFVLLYVHSRLNWKHKTLEILSLLCFVFVIVLQFCLHEAFVDVCMYIYKMWPLYGCIYKHKRAQVR